MKFRIDRRIRIGYFTAYFLLIICYLLFFFTNNQMLEETEKTDNIKESITKLQVLLSEMKDIEIGFREYLLINDEQFLDPYCTAEIKMPNTIKEIRRLIDKSSPLQERLTRLQLLIDHRLKMITEELDMFKRHKMIGFEKNIIIDSSRIVDTVSNNNGITDYNAAIDFNKKILDEPDIGLDTVANMMQPDRNLPSPDLFYFTMVADSIKTLSKQGKLIIDSIKKEVLSLQSSQRSLIDTKRPVLAGFSKTIKLVNLISLIIASLIALYSIITYTRENQARRKADEKALLYRKQLEQRIEQLNVVNEELTHLKSIEKFAATGRMARMIAHEVRNPLTNIGLANDQLAEILNPDEEEKMLLNMIRRNSERISNLVSNLLDSTKLVELKRSEISVNHLIDETLEMAKDRIKLNAITIEKKFTAGSCKLVVDKEKVKIALLNIIVNAIEAMEPNIGILEITTSKLNNFCSIMITDNGEGMSADALSRLFEPFFTSKEKGNGLGLANTQNIIIQHKGNILVKSELGKGTSFTINLPIG